MKWTEKYRPSTLEQLEGLTKEDGDLKAHLSSGEIDFMIPFQRTIKQYYFMEMQVLEKHHLQLHYQEVSVGKYMN